MVHVALLAGVLAGCAETGEEKDAQASPSVSASAAKSTGSGGTIGAAGSACVLPVAFDLAAEWEAEAIADTGDVDEDLASLLRQGPVTTVCEIDAKPAGHIGYIRVFTGEPGEDGENGEDDARTVLEAFVTAQDGASDPKFGTFEAGGLAGAEVEYLATSDLLEETKPERAFAVVTEDGPVVVHLGGLDAEEHRAMLPAYELAKETLHSV